MRIESVRIKNFKGIKELKIEFRPGFNLIKGENGRGKTSILEAISVGLGGYIAGIEGVAARHFSKDEIRREYTVIGDGSCDCVNNIPVEVELEAIVNGEPCRWLRSRNSVQASRSTIQPRQIAKIAEKMCQSEETELPVLIYQGAGRVWAKKHEKAKSPFQKKYVRTVGYMDSLLEASNIKLLQNWCIKMEMVSWQKKMQVAEYEAVKKAVADFMNNMDSGSDYKVFYDTQLEQIMCQNGDNILPVSDLSAGYQSLIWMVFDIAFRMAVLNPARKSEIAQVAGIVLIDEIDMHLHPKWQWKIIDALTKVFPNVQFIGSTHAPILFAAAKKIRVIDIDSGDVEYSYSNYGIDINTSLNKYQETFEMAEPVKYSADRFLDALDEENYEEAQLILENLEQIVEPENPLILNLRKKNEKVVE